MGGPPIPSEPIGIRLLGNPTAPIVVELFQDVACPYSKKMMLTLLDGDDSVLKRLEKHATLSGGKVEFVFHNLPQPWHPQSPSMHEGFFAYYLATGKDSAKVIAYLNAFYKEQKQFEDIHTKDKSRVGIHDMCVEIAKSVESDDAVIAKMKQFLSFDHLTPEEGNMGLGAVTKELKFSIKHHRLRGVHVTPTVFVNMIEASDMSSSWSADQFIEKLESILA
mmetsp:Transcript_17470/g.49340  ORF Transcript_17470/g.49340 Transcript_17470/m.49340 type:complete len:221 (-) Transcript_17470:474-1136(-)